MILLEGFNTEPTPRLRTVTSSSSLQSQRSAGSDHQGDEGRGREALLVKRHLRLYLIMSHGIARRALRRSSLPPDFAPQLSSDRQCRSLLSRGRLRGQAILAPYQGVFWMLGELCDAFQMPFDLMIVVNRRVYPRGFIKVSRSLRPTNFPYPVCELFNPFQCDFCVSVLRAGKTKSCPGYSWIFPNVGHQRHWWYSHSPAYIDSTARVASASPCLKRNSWVTTATCTAELPCLNTTCIAASWARSWPTITFVHQLHIIQGLGIGSPACLLTIQANLQFGNNTITGTIFKKPWSCLGAGLACFRRADGPFGLYPACP